MEQINALVADDELPARGELKYELASIPGVKIVGECANGKEVLSFLKSHPNVDILFLDIEMPIMNGLECAEKILAMDLPPENRICHGIQPVRPPGLRAGSL